MLDDLEVSKVGTPAHVAQVDEANHKSDEPVSSTTLNVCEGVPTVIEPTYDESDFYTKTETKRNQRYRSPPSARQYSDRSVFHAGGRARVFPDARSFVRQGRERRAKASKQGSRKLGTVGNSSQQPAVLHEQFCRPDGLARHGRREIEHYFLLNHLPPSRHRAASRLPPHPSAQRTVPHADVPAYEGCDQR